MSNKKRLHIHAAPLAVFALIATLAVLTLGTASYNNDTRQAFVRPLVKFAPTASGLSSVQLNGPTTKAEILQQAVAKATQTPALPGIEGLGRSTALQLSAQ